MDGIGTVVVEDPAVGEGAEGCIQLGLGALETEGSSAVGGGVDEVDRCGFRAADIQGAVRHRKGDLELAIDRLRVVGVADGEARDREISVFINGEGRGDGRRHRGVVHRRDGDGNGLGRCVRETVGDDVGDDREGAEAFVVIAVQRQRDRTILCDGNTALAGHRS